MTFAVLDATRIVSMVDHKRKRTRSLRRLANIAENPSVALLADHYEEEWSRLWWVRADGSAQVIASPGDRPELWSEACAALARRYEQYRVDEPRGPLIVVAVGRWSAWSA